MNLIEMLGGYEKAKAALNWVEKNNPVHDWVKPILYEQLLNYRREHRIFEVGDKVVNDGLIAPHIYIFKKLMPEISMALVVRNGDEVACGLFRLRHATDEEIKAGHRL